MISTHSRFVLDIAEEANIFWVHDGKIVSKEYDSFKVLADLGALDKGDLLKNGQIKCVVLTEDDDDNMLKNVLQASGFDMSETDIWSYQCCTNLQTAIVLVNFIKKHAPAVKVVIHRDRDYLTETEQGEYIDGLNEEIDGKAYCFITRGSDIESYYLNAAHISTVYPDITEKEAQDLIEEAMNSRKKDSLAKFINSRVGIEEKVGRKKNKHVDSGAISIECTDQFQKDPVYYRHGKSVIKELKYSLQNTKKKSVDPLLSYSRHLSDPNLTLIANEIWSET